MAGRGESEVEPYGSREGVLQAPAVLGGEALPNELREQVIEDTLRGAPAAKSAWTERGMVEDVTKGLDAVGLPVTVVVGDRDQVEHGGYAEGSICPLSSAGNLSPAARSRTPVTAGTADAPD